MAVGPCACAMPAQSALLAGVVSALVNGAITNCMISNAETSSDDAGCQAIKEKRYYSALIAQSETMLSLCELGYARGQALS